MNMINGGKEVMQGMLAKYNQSNVRIANQLFPFVNSINLMQSPVSIFPVKLFFELVSRQ